MTAPSTILRNSDKENRAPPAPRRVTFQTSDERKQELLKWRKEQQEFRLQLMQRELLQQQQRQLQEQMQRRRPPSGKMVAWFIVGFLAMIPLMSTYQDNHMGTLSSTAVTAAKNGTMANNSSSGSASSNGGSALGSSSETLVVSVSHVDYNILPTPKSVVLHLREPQEVETSENEDTDDIKNAGKLSDAGCRLVADDKIPRDVRIVQSRPLWTLQLEKTPLQDSTFLTVAIVGETPGQRSTILAIALLHEDEHNIDKGMTQRLDFVRPLRSLSNLDVNAESNNQMEISNQDSSVQIQLLLFGRCSKPGQPEVGLPDQTDEAISAAEQPHAFAMPILSTSVYTAALASAPPAVQDFAMPPFPVSLGEESMDSVVIFFGWDESFREMQRYYQYGVTNRGSGTIDSDSEGSDLEASQQTRLKMPRLRHALPKLLPILNRKDRQEDVADMLLALANVPTFLEQLEESYGEVLQQAAAPTNRTVVLVVGSSIQDVLAFHLRRTQPQNSTTSATGGGRRSLRSNSRRTSLADQTPPSPDVDVQSSVEGDSLEDTHLLACQKLVHSLQELYPSVSLVWRLPLFVPGRPSGQLAQAERSMITEPAAAWKVPTWDLYTASYVWWAENQHLLGEEESAGSAMVEYGSEFYEQISQAALAGIT